MCKVLRKYMRGKKVHQVVLVTLTLVTFKSSYLFLYKFLSDIFFQVK